jgi:pseudouridine kinase
MKKVICIGAATIDVKAVRSQELSEKNFSAGKVYISPGGIARNMVENLSRLGCEAYLLSAVGKDTFGDLILRETKKSGANITFVKRCADASTIIYVAILNDEGVAQYEVIETSVAEYISPTYLEQHTDLLVTANLLFADTNPPAESLIFLAHLAQRENIPLHVTTSSLLSASRVLSIIDKISILSTNKDEAEKLAGRAITSHTQAIEVGMELLSKGVRKVIITLGSEGIVYCDRSYTCYRNALSAHVVETTGAGDAFSSGFLFGLLNGHKINYCLEYGLAAAALTVEDAHTVSPYLSTEAVELRRTEDLKRDVTLENTVF